MLENFNPSAEPIWPYPLRCGPFAVPKYSFTARRLSAAATSTREMSGLRPMAGRGDRHIFQTQSTLPGEVVERWLEKIAAF
jgi:hypothetical protein